MVWFEKTRNAAPGRASGYAGLTWGYDTWGYDLKD